MNYHLYSRKKKKLSRLLKQLNRTTQNTVQFKQLIWKIRKVVQDLNRVLSFSELRKLLGPAIVFLGLSVSTINAQQFDMPVTNAFGAGNGATNDLLPAMVDLDGDKDFDILYGNPNGLLSYQENIGNSIVPVFDTTISNPFNFLPFAGFCYPEFADMDADGDFDLLVGHFQSSVTYFENIGTSLAPNFTTPISTPFGLISTKGYLRVNAADMDGDGDLDVLGSNLVSEFEYFENIGTSASSQFASPLINPFGLAPPAYTDGCDIKDWDMDGDMDIITTDINGDFYYFENIGTTSPQFSLPVMNPFGLVPVHNDYVYAESADLDGDGDLDLLLGTPVGTEYYENISMITTATKNQATAMGLQVFPNPAVKFLTVSAHTDQEVIVSIYDQSGKLLFEKQQVLLKNGYQLPVNRLAAGNYLLKVKNRNGNIGTRPFIVIQK